MADCMLVYLLDLAQTSKSFMRQSKVDVFKRWVQGADSGFQMLWRSHTSARISQFAHICTCSLSENDGDVVCSGILCLCIYIEVKI